MLSAAQAQGPCKASEELTTLPIQYKVQSKIRSTTWSPCFADSEPYQSSSPGAGVAGWGWGQCLPIWFLQVKLVFCLAAFSWVLCLVFSSCWGLSLQSLMLFNILQHRRHPGFCEAFRNFPQPSQLPHQLGVTV